MGIFECENCKSYNTKKCKLLNDDDKIVPGYWCFDCGYGETIA